MTDMLQAEMVLFHVLMGHVNFPKNGLETETFLVFIKARELEWIRHDLSFRSFVFALKKILAKKELYNRLAYYFLYKLRKEDKKQYEVSL